MLRRDSPPRYPIVNLSHLFRVGSLSKPLTAIGLLGVISPDTLLSMEGGYENALQLHFGLPMSAFHVASVRQSIALQLSHEFPVHLIDLEKNTDNHFELNSEWLPAQYTSNFPFSAPAGGWVMSAETLVRLFQRMGGPGLDGDLELLAPLVVQAIATGSAIDSQNVGLGFGFQSISYHPEDPTAQSANKTMLYWNGSVSGGISTAAHLIPNAPPSPSNLQDNLSIAMVLNISGGGEIGTANLNDIARIAEAIEHVGGFT